MFKLTGNKTVRLIECDAISIIKDYISDLNDIRLRGGRVGQRVVLGHSESRLVRARV